MAELEHFVNAGYGWTCKRCQPETAPPVQTSPARARFFSEGESEEREPALCATALARWRDESHRTLVCPRCHTEENINKTTR